MVLDGETLKIVKTIPTERRPRGIIVSPDHKEIYVACGDGDIIDVSGSPGRAPGRKPWPRPPSSE
jgi:DNA-binding beta-propeller fold protein YncE